MKKMAYIFILVPLAFGGRLGMGVSGGGEYAQDYRIISLSQIHDVFYGAEFALQAEAVPNVFLEALVSYLNNPSESSANGGLDLGITIEPRIGRFPIAPLFGIKGILFFNNELDMLRDGQFDEYIETSSPRLLGAGFAGLSFSCTRCVTVNCQYRCLGLAPRCNTRMIWIGLFYYINW